MFFANITHQGVYVFTDGLDLLVIGGLSVRLVLELNKFILLVQNSVQTFLTYLLGNDFFRLLRSNSKEVSKFFKGNVHVQLRNHLDIVLDTRIFQDWKAIRVFNFLMSFERISETFYVSISKQFTSENFLEEITKRIFCDSGIFYQQRNNSWSLRSSWGKDCSCKSTTK